MPLRPKAAVILALLMFTGCSPAHGDKPPPASEPAATDRTDSDRRATAGDAPSDVGPGDTGAGQAQGGAATATGTDVGEVALAAACIPPAGPAASDASLEGRAGEYHLTMVEQVDGSPSRTTEGSLTLLAQVESLRQFTGSAGGSIPRVTSPLFGSTDMNVEDVGAVRVGNLSSEDPESPGVLVIESETGAGPSILLRLGSDANGRNLVRFDGGYTVLNVVEITAESFSGTWSSGTQGPDSEGFFCATPGR